MATLYITEYARAAITRSGNLPVGEDAPLAEQTVAIAAGSAQSANLNANTVLVRLHTDAICSVAFGANPTATATNRRMAANTTEYFGIDQTAPAAKKYAVIVNT